jgi:hypothetical protein
MQTDLEPQPMKALRQSAYAHVPGPAWVARLAIVSRIAAALLGGYALAVVASITLVAVLPGGRADAVLGATQLSFAIHVAAVLWAFSARSAARAWLGILAPAALLAPLAWVLAGGAAS